MGACCALIARIHRTFVGVERRLIAVKQGSKTPLQSRARPIVGVFASVEQGDCPDQIRRSLTDDTALGVEWSCVGEKVSQNACNCSD